MKQGGLLLIGWNHDVSADPLENPIYKDLFYKSGYEDLPTRTRFTNSTHVFDFLKAK